MKSLPKPTCPECEKFDQETKDLLAKILHPDEITLIATLLSASIKVQAQAMKQNENNIKIRMTCKRNMDFYAAIAGKLLIGIEQEPRDALISAILKHHGVALRLTHGPCPHEKQNGK